VKKRVPAIGLSMALLFAMALVASDLSAQTKRGAAVPADQLPEKLRALDIRDSFIGSNLNRAGIIHSLKGTAIVIHQTTNEAYFAQEGDLLYEKDAIETIANSRCRVRLINEDVVSLAQNTLLALDEVSMDRKKREKTSFLSMLKGKAMFYALRLFSFKQASTRLKTPTAVVGVRGTKFAVHVYEKEETKAGEPLLLASADTSLPYLAQGPGGTVTLVFSIDGTVTVNNQSLGPGQAYDAGMIRPLTPQEIKALEIEIFGQEVGIISGVITEEGLVLTIEEGDLEGLDLGDEETISTIVQNLVTGGTTTTAPAVGPYGYFTALLANSSGYYASTYTSTSRQDFGAAAEGGTIEAFNTSGKKMVATGQGGWEDGTPYLKSVGYNGSTSGDLGTNNPISHAELGSNTYLEWGYWYSTAAIPIPGASDYYVDSSGTSRMGYYVFGPNPADIGALSGTYAYSGDAYGTMFPSYSQPVAMQGTFSCDISFGSRSSVSDFTLDVSGGGYMAYIGGASGILTPGENHIDLNYSSEWQLGTTSCMYDADYGDVKGSFYGPNAEEIGGVWNMGNSSYHATGIFGGTGRPNVIDGGQKESAF